MSLETKCRTMVDCLEQVWPCAHTGACWTTCLNAASGSAPLDSCVQAITTAACGP